MQKLNKFFEKLTSSLIWASGVVFIVVAVIVVISIIMRALFSAPIMGNVEIVQFGVMFAVALVIGRTTFLDQHTRITMLTDAMPAVIQKILYSIMKLIGLGVFGVLFVMLISEMRRALERSRVTEIFRLPYYVVYIILLVGVGVTMIVLFYQSVLALIEVFKKSDPPDQGAVNGADSQKK